MPAPSRSVSQYHIHVRFLRLRGLQQSDIPRLVCRKLRPYFRGPPHEEDRQKMYKHKDTTRVFGASTEGDQSSDLRENGKTEVISYDYARISPDRRKLSRRGWSVHTIVALMPELFLNAVGTRRCGTRRIRTPNWPHEKP